MCSVYMKKNKKRKETKIVKEIKIKVNEDQLIKEIDNRPT